VEPNNRHRVQQEKKKRKRKETKDIAEYTVRNEKNTKRNQVVELPAESKLQSPNPLFWLD
jgi:hypothetical protein